VFSCCTNGGNRPDRHAEWIEVSTMPQPRGRP
jgi:hypothetical protein